jgi:multiple sugar transport system permease protein
MGARLESPNLFGISRVAHRLAYRVTWGKVLLVLFMAAMLVFVLLPFLMMVLTSFKTLPEINDMANRNLLRRYFPDDIANTENYIGVILGTATQLNGLSFLVFIRNSLIVTCVSLLPAFVLGTTAAYGFAKFEFPFKTVMFFMLLGLLMIPLEMVSVPLYLILAKLGMVDTYHGIMVPYMISAFGMFMLMEAMAPIPRDYVDAARIDGAGEFWIFARVILPMVKTQLITFVIIKFLWTWNEFFWPLIVVNSEEMKTVTLGLAKFSTDLFQRYGELSAAVVLSILPTLVIYVGSRRFIQRGLMMAGVKG